MTVLTADRNTPRRENEHPEGHPLKGGSLLFAGALVMLDATGLAIPGRSAPGLYALGRADAHVDARQSADGDLIAPVRRGIFRFGNSDGGDAITRAQIGRPAYAVDDQTLAKTDNAGARSPAGIIRDVDAQGVWVEL